jgi:hypothetical protein
MVDTSRLGYFEGTREGCNELLELHGDACDSIQRSNVDGKFMSPGEEMIVRNSENIASLGRLRRDLKVGLKEVTHLVDIGNIVTREFELVLREKYVFPPWRLYSSRGLSNEEFRVVRNHRNTYLPIKKDGLNYLIQPVPFAKHNEVPSYAHPELIVSYAHESMIRNITKASNRAFHKADRLYLGRPIEESEKSSAIEAGYTIAQLLNGEFRVVYPTPLIVKGGYRAPGTHEYNDGEVCIMNAKESVRKRLEF